ncbi:MAG TPA: FAD-dependent oxidoreductase [Candidatus Saccharimonadales bacterium]|nr:FAD-dependent oxidoreductase [Candidatus Saccharimonadales bacterium]
MELTLLHKEHLVDNIWAFRFQPTEPLAWTAGQYVRVELPQDNPDSEGTKRWFTNSAAPYEGVLQITTRITQSSFKQTLVAIKEGSSALQLIEKPDGDFIWQDSSLPIVFIAGGIGITPFYSILKQRIHDGLSIPATLIYGGRTNDLPFRAEFAQWAATSQGFTVHYVVGKPLTAESLAEIVPSIDQSLVYLSGPEPMVEALGNKLKAIGLPPAQLKQDFFPNYNGTNY